MDPFLTAEVVIGFEPVTYSANEADGLMTFTIRLLNSTLSQSVVIEFFTESGSAMGELQPLSCNITKFLLLPI